MYVYICKFFSFPENRTGFILLARYFVLPLEK